MQLWLYIVILFSSLTIPTLVYRNSFFSFFKSFENQYFQLKKGKIVDHLPVWSYLFIIY